MSRTYRKDKRGNKHPEGIFKKNSGYICRCEFCTGVDKKELEEKLADKDMKKQLFNALEWNHSVNLDMDDYHEFTASSLQEERNWTEYLEKQAA